MQKGIPDLQPPASSAAPTPPPTTTSPQAAPFSINLDYLAPTLSAILAGIIHHVCNKKEPLTLVEFLLIVSPSMPIICQTFIKIITWMINGIVNNIWSVNPFTPLLSYFAHTPFTPLSHYGLKDDGLTPILHQYTTTKTPAEKMVEWQANNYYIQVYNNTTKDGVNVDHMYFILRLIREVTHIYADTYDSFYYQTECNGEQVEVYLEDKKLYLASTGKACIKIDALYNKLYPPVYTENTSKYRISNIHNKYASEIFQTIVKYKQHKSNHAINLNFLFYGKPGTCKTYAARAIAMELGRKLVEIDLKTVVYEDEFLELFVKYPPSSYVYLLDEIDLMCPTRELDDAIMKQLEMDKMDKLTKVSGPVSSNMSTYSDDDKSWKDDMVLHHINTKLDSILQFQDWMKMCIMLIIRLLYRIIATIVNQTVPSKNSVLLHGTAAGNIPYQEMHDTIYDILSGEKKEYNISSSSSSAPYRKLFSLRTLLNFISGGNTPDGLCICGTTNRPEVLPPELTRPGRLRKMHFEYLRVEDAVNILYETYKSDGYNKDTIEEQLQTIPYTDYRCSGALLMAIISSTISFPHCIEVFRRELADETQK